MDNPKQNIKNIIRITNFVLLQLLMIFTLNACSNDSNKNNAQDKVVVSDNKLSAPLPAQIADITTDNLEVGIAITGSDGVTTHVCNASNGLVVDQGLGTFSCGNISLPPGNYTLVLEFTVIDDVYGSVIVAASSAISIEVIGGQTTEADFSTTTYTYLDNDNDGVNNLDELYAGTNPGDSACVLDESVLDGCTLG